MNLLLRLGFVFFILFQGTLLAAQILSTENEEISIYLGWEHQFQFAGFYAAIEQGYFSKHNLDVKLIARTDEVSTEVVANGHYDYGIATGANLISSKYFDDLSVMAAIMQQSPVSLITLKGQGINTLQDLNGKDIVAGTEIKSMLISAGVDINTLNFYGRTSSFQNLISGKYKAITYFITDRAKLIGNDSLMFTIYRPIEYGINFYGECLFTSRDEAMNNPDRVQNIRNAVINGWEYAINNQQEIIELIKTKYGSNLSKEELGSEAEIIIHSLILPKFYDVGDMQKSKWLEMSKLMRNFSIIADERELADFIYMEPQSSENDTKQIIQISAIIISLVVSIVLLLLLYNYQLTKAVKTRTVSLEKANQELDRFVYSISHDIRAPLSSVQGLITLLKIDPEGNDKYIDLIESSILKLDAFTKDILDYTRNSRTQIKSEEVVLKNLIDKCVSQVILQSETNEISIDRNILVEEPILNDGWRLEVIISNLLSNSIRYSDKNKKDSFIKISAFDQDGEVHISISDNGIGIKEEHQDKIFNMFYRASENSQGSGLGLYIVKETINLIGAKINIQSKENIGTTVNIVLPK